jgi:hypothetical protein
LSHRSEPGEDRCVIRNNLRIEYSFWTYCANHPHHNPKKIKIPVGPVYVCEEESHGRKVLADAPDTPNIRQELVQLLEHLPEKPLEDYPTETKLDHELIKHLGLLREPAAVGGLRRVLSFNPDESSGGTFSRDRRLTVGYALEALARILRDEALKDIEKFLRYGLNKPRLFDRLPRKDTETRYAPIRYFAVEALAHCSAASALPLLDQAARDPHPDVADHARRTREQLPGLVP